MCNLLNEKRFENTTVKHRLRPEVSPKDSHYPFYCALKAGEKVWRNDPLNNIREWLTLDHPSIQGDPANITNFGYNDLSLEHDPLMDAALQLDSQAPNLS